MNTKITEESGSAWDAVWVEIHQPREMGVMGSGVRMVMTLDNADFNCLRLSKAMPEARIVLMMAARNKAVYEGGTRVQQSDMRKFYDLTDDEYAKTKVRNSLYNGKDQLWDF